MLPENVPLKRPPYREVNTKALLGAYELLKDLLDSGQIVRGVAFSELAASAHDPDYVFSGEQTAEILTVTNLVGGVTNDGRLYIPSMYRAIIMASTEPGVVGYNLVSLGDVIDLPDDL